MTQPQKCLNTKANQVIRTKDKKDKMNLIKRIHVFGQKKDSLLGMERNSNLPLQQSLKFQTFGNENYNNLIKLRKIITTPMTNN